MKLNRKHNNPLSKSEIDLFDKIKSGDVKGIRKLLTDQRTRKKININCFDDDDFTPMFVAITDCNDTDIKPMIRILLKYGAQINIQNSVGKSLIHHTCHYFFDGTDKVVNMLLQNGADPDLSDLKGRTPLYAACRSENVVAIKSLLLYNADVNCPNNEGETPLMYACDNPFYDEEQLMGVAEIVSVLLENNASVILLNDKGQTALHIACLRANDDAIEMLLRHGADPNVRATDGLTPLHCACQAGCHRSIQMLLECNVDTNCLDNDGNTPLHRLVERLEYETPARCLRALLEHKFRERKYNFDIKNFNGETPLLCAVRIHAGDNLGFIADVVDLFLMLRSDVNVQCRAVGVIGDTILHVAVRNNNKKLVQIIVNHKPDLKICNINKQTALDLAKELGHIDITKCIEEPLHKIRCQMYTFYSDAWCHHLSDSPSNLESISPVRKRKAKRKQYSSKQRKKVKTTK